MLHWLSTSGGRCGAAVQAYLGGTLNMLAQGPAATAGMRVQLPEDDVVGASGELTAAWAAEAARRQGAWAEYCAAFAPIEGAGGLAEGEEPHGSAFPTSMPCYTATPLASTATPTHAFSCNCAAARPLAPPFLRPSAMRPLALIVAPPRRRSMCC